MEQSYLDATFSFFFCDSDGFASNSVFVPSLGLLDLYACKCAQK
jgi:hypothetical protein